MPAPPTSKNQSAPHDMSVILVTGSYDHEIRFWEAWSGICSRTTGETGQVNRLAISHDKRFLAAAVHKKIYIYEISTFDLVCIFIGSILSGECFQLATFEKHSNNVTSLAFNSEGKWLVSGSEDGNIKIWDLWSPTNTSPNRSYENSAPVNDICIHPNQGVVISCDQAGSIKQWDLSDNICSHELTLAGEIPIRSITLAADGSCLVAGNYKGECFVWKVNNEEISGLPRFQAVTKFMAHGRYVTRCLLSPDARYVISLWK